MSCFLFSLRFTAPVHFGLSDAAMSLYASEETFRADTFFSALCHTALHAEGEAGVTRLCEAVRRGELTLSDAIHSIFQSPLSMRPHPRSFRQSSERP